ncbi:MAG: DUF4129 domain-containing protein [Jaaginema sp. PMC 1079.18]|nr:DUF4129 domain-containing protein [Jaaginema sp. PMC 1080.18]MEC4853318.1 DUF4129 domain-containing protein [Jaaginema sp. PMC 1079.18]MEC4866734.1 DUF4129 domain-containing protein [Jaaginema sp. PMC 1078.18]
MMSQSVADRQNSLGWQFHLFQKRLGEAWEYWTSRWGKGLSDSWDRDWSNWQDLTNFVFWGLLVMLSIWLLWLLGKALLPRLWARLRYSRLQKRSQRTRAATTSVASVNQWWARSQSFAQGGDYHQACIAVYLAMLQHLHDRGIAPHKSSRTDGEYLKIIQQLPQPQPYQTLLITHQQLCFSDRPASLQLWEQCQQAYKGIVGNSGAVGKGHLLG